MTTTPTNTPSEALEDVLQSLGDGDHKLRVYRVSPQGIEICETFTADTFSEEAVARNWGPGAYEVHVYEKGRRGMRTKRSFRIAARPGEAQPVALPPPRPVPQHASAYTMPAEAGVFGMLMQMQQQQFQMQLEAAKADRSMFLSLIEKLGQRSETMPEIGALDQMMRFAEKLTRTQDREINETSALLQTLPGLIEAINKTHQGRTSRPSMPPGQRIRALARHGALPGPRAFDNGQPVDAAPGRIEDEAPGGAPTTTPPTVRTLIDVLRAAVALPDPDPSTYCNVVIDLLGEDTIQAAIDGYEPGHFAGLLCELDAHLASRRDFLLAIEQDVRAVFLDSEGDPADTGAGVGPASASSPPVDAAHHSHASTPASGPSTDGDAAPARRARSTGGGDPAHNARSRA